MTLDTVELAGEVRRRAVEEGFDVVGIARADALDRDGQALAAWLRSDYQATMAWMARDPAMRADPRRVLPGCRSVIVAGMNYWPGAEATRPTAGRPRTAAYALGRDYHKVLGRRLRRVADWLAERTETAARAFVDTGPVLERAWTERAGVGWIGKNANLIHPRLGSWLLLGEILSVAELDADPGPHADRCGRCTACLDACPTRAIVEPGVVDSNLCISYWTIEHRGPVPHAIRSGIGEWIFGCDVCQEVCPWNVRFAATRADEAFERREDLGALDAEALVGMDEGSFRARYSGTSLMRATWRGMRRNACIVLGNRGDASALTVLGAALDDADAMIRGHAAWAIGRIGGAVARRALARAVDRESDAGVREEIDLALADAARFE